MRHSVLFATAFATLISTQTFAADLPGKGITVNPVQSTITEETFQTLLVSRALEKLGYTVNKPSEVDYNVGYTSLASGDATFTAVNWTPLHDNMYEAAGGDKKFYREGVFVNGAAQGYLIDKKTADQYKITNIAQLKDPKIAKLFDTNGDGKADLTGCNPGWGCEGAINHQLAAYGLTNTVTHNQGNYAAMMADTSPFGFVALTRKPRATSASRPPSAEALTCSRRSMPAEASSRAASPSFRKGSWFAAR